MTTRDQGPLARASTTGPSLYRYAVMPDRSPEAVVAVLHGYGEYGARYDHVMAAWAERGIASVAIDLRGHGRAGGRRGYCGRFAEYLDDVRELELLAAAVTSDPAGRVPLFLFGHSLGGLVATAAALAKPSPWRGLILSAPFFGIGPGIPVSPAKQVAGRIASRLLPWLAQPNGIRSADVTHDAAIARAYEKDPLVFHIATARWFTEARAAQARVLEQAGALAMPLHVVMGTGDRIAKLEKARAFFDRAGSSDKTWEEREGLFHEVLNEPEWPSIADRIADFVLSRR
jgi:alpha-beta hydrolase superfamily lysophospholipase